MPISGYQSDNREARRAAARNGLPPDTPWTLAEVAAFYREDERTTRRRVARGELEAIRLPGSRRLLFNPTEVRQFVSANAGSPL